TLEHERHWQHASLLVHSSEDDYVKLAYTQGQVGDRFVEFWSESDGVRDKNEPNSTNDSDALVTIHLRLSSDAENLTAAYSFDGETSTTLEGTATLPPEATFGLVAAGDTGTPDAVAQVDHFRVTPDRDDDGQRDPSD